MNLTRVLCLATVASAAAPAAAVDPTIGFVNNGDNTVTLQITPDAASLPGSVAAELAVTAGISLTGGIDITGAVIGDPVFSRPNPGDSPFIPGSVIGGDANGLNVNAAFDEIFVAYGSEVLTTPGPRDLLIISFTGVGTIEAFGLVAQASTLVDGLTASITIIPEPTSALLCLGGLAGVLVRRR